MKKYNIRTFCLFLGTTIYSIIISFIIYILVDNFQEGQYNEEYNLHIRYAYIFKEYLHIQIRDFYRIIGSIYVILSISIIVMSFRYRLGKLWFAILLPIIYTFFNLGEITHTIQVTPQKYIRRGAEVYDARGRFLAQCDNFLINEKKGIIELFEYTSNDTLRGYCNMQWEVILPCKYEIREMPHDFIRAYDPESEKTAILTSDYEIALPPDIYTNIREFPNFLIISRDPKDDYSCGVCDYNGNIIIPFEYENIYATDYFYVTKNNLCGIYDLDGNVLIPYGEYTGAVPYGDFYKVNKDGKFGLLDKNCNTIVPCKYNYIMIGRNYEYGDYISCHIGTYNDLYDLAGNLLEHNEH